MSDVKQRVVDELKKLNEKNNALVDFITNSDTYQKLKKSQQGLLVLQSQIMSSYCSVLDIRLDNWED